MMVYLDNSATTAVCPAAAEKAVYMMTNCFGNPSSLHTLGFHAEQEMTAARRIAADWLGVKPAELVFTSGGTESNNLALFGATEAKKRQGRHVVTTAVEHSSIMAACTALEQAGWEITRLQPDAQGQITPAQVVEACRPDTVLVSVMMVNNETGARFRVENMAIPSAASSRRGIRIRRTGFRNSSGRNRPRSRTRPGSYAPPWAG